MQYKLATALGLLSTIIYFDVCSDYYHSIVEYTDQVIWQLSPEEILIRNYNRQLHSPTPVTQNVFLGFNGNIDVILDGPKFLNGIPSEVPSEVDLSTINSVTQLKSTFNYFFKRQTAAERSVGDQLAWDEIVKLIEGFPEKSYFIGGNAALIARTMSKNNVQIKLAIPAGPELISQLEEHGLSVMESCLKSRDEFHVILEYGVGSVYEGHTSTRANRFIFSRDVANSEMDAINCFTKGDLNDLDVVVIAGFHMLENQPEHTKQQVLGAVQEKVLEHRLVHLELASMTRPDFLLQLFNSLALRVHSLGLNEAELAFLSEVLGGPPVTESVESVKDALLFLLSKATGGSHQLSRIHFHCLTFHVIVEKTGKWKNGATAVAIGTLTAARYACDTPSLVADNHELRWTGAGSKPVVSEKRLDGITIHVSPVLVCKRPLKTVGLGDSISATGLLYTSII